MPHSGYHITQCRYQVTQYRISRCAFTILAEIRFSEANMRITPRQSISSLTQRGTGSLKSESMAVMDFTSWRLADEEVASDSCSVASSPTSATYFCSLGLGNRKTGADIDIARAFQMVFPIAQASFSSIRVFSCVGSGRLCCVGFRATAF